MDLRFSTSLSSTILIESYTEHSHLYWLDGPLLHTAGPSSKVRFIRLTTPKEEKVLQLQVRLTFQRINYHHHSHWAFLTVYRVMMIADQSRRLRHY